ncbi:MAG: ATP-dependent helicase [Propionibacteriaceae bacterium]
MEMPKLRLVSPSSSTELTLQLDDTQRRVVGHRRGPLLVVAGPGTGKTTTLVEHVLSRINDCAKSEEILILTFSRKAATELRHRIVARLGHASTVPAAMTFHALCHIIVNTWGYSPEQEPGATTVRLLTAPEQEFRLREILNGAGAHLWPTELEAAVETRGFASQLRHVLARARQLNMDPSDIQKLGDQVGKAEWSAAGRFFDEYLDVLDFEQALDYPELVHRTRLLLADPEIGPAIRKRYPYIVVDEYQDTDPAQAAVLSLLTGKDGNVVAFADPDQAIYRFRGADSAVVAQFSETFSGECPCEIVTLDTCWRYGSEISAVVAKIADRLPILPGLKASQVHNSRHIPATKKPGKVEIFSYDSESAHGQYLAHYLQQAHLRDGIPWSQMAVLVREGRSAIPALSRALIAGGVPVSVAGDEIPLVQEAAVKPLLTTLRILAQEQEIAAGEAEKILTSAWGGFDAVLLRKTGRWLRKNLGAELANKQLTSADLIARVLMQPDLVKDSTEPYIQKLHKISQILMQVRDEIASGAGPHQALWLLWQATAWAQEMRVQALKGGESGQQAHHDLDAICALFDLAARKETMGNLGLLSFLAEVENQEIPGDTDREESVRREAVAVMTAHRAKGMEWDLVVVAGLQEGLWPNLRRHNGLLEAERLELDHIAPPEPLSSVLAQERRLFYVASTRARRQLVLTTVVGEAGQSEIPSRFLADLDLPITHIKGYPRRPLTLSALTASLRRISVDPEESPLVREAAASRLALLTAATDDDGYALVPLANPEHWWGLNELTTSDQNAIAKDNEPIRLSGSSLAALLMCPRQWFLERQVRAETARGIAQGIGSLVHLIAQHAAINEWSVTEMVERLDQAWDQLAFETPWYATAERGEAEAALARFDNWQSSRDRELVGVEVPFDTVIDLGDDQVRLVGAIDRIERDKDSRIHIVDLKTGRLAATKKEAESSEQLGVYQLVALNGGLADLGNDIALGSAELVYLRVADKDTQMPTVRSQESLTALPHREGIEDHESTWIHELLRRAARIVREGTFPATEGSACNRCRFTRSCPVRLEGKQILQ